MGTSRALRVALIQSGRIVEDRTFTGRAKITVGTEAKSTFLVPMGNLPLTTAVFDVTKKGTRLLFDHNTEGRLKLAGSEAPLQEYAGRASAMGKQLSLTLPEDARGRVSIGEVSLLFQFVDRPRPQVAAQLPKGARGLVAQLDRSFLAILAISLAAHFAGVGYLSTQPVPEERDLTMEELSQERWAAVMMPPRPPKPTEPERPAIAAAPRPTAIPAAKPQVAPSAEAIKAKVRKMGIVGIIGSKGDGEGGLGLGDIMKDTGMTPVADAMRFAKDGVQVASADDATTTTRKGEDTGSTSQIEGPVTERVQEVGLNERKNKGPAAVTMENCEAATTEIDPLKLTSWMQGRKPAIQGCYERELKRSPNLAGRLVIRFTITSRGRVNSVGFDEDTLRSPAVQQCIAALMRGWVLPFTPEDEVPVSLPFIFAGAK